MKNSRRSENIVEKNPPGSKAKDKEMKSGKCFKIRKVERQYSLYHIQIIGIPEREKKINGEEEIKQ